jgi:hypothetical protein
MRLELNVEHPTSNTEHRILQQFNVERSMLDVRCSIVFYGSVTISLRPSG